MRRAFTMVELIIVIGIIGLLAAIIIPSFGIWRERTVVRSAARDIESVLKLARSKSLASEDGAKYGVAFYGGNSQYFNLCKNTSNDSTCTTYISSHDLPVSLAFCSTALTAPVFFKKLTGEYEGASADLIIYFYNKNKIASPCGSSSLTTECLSAKTCGGVTITKSGVIYEKQ